jgi:uncharacterized protein involved in exopolysaccharide biosynthesis
MDHLDSNGKSNSSQFDDEVDLLELWRALMRGKWIIIGVTLLFSVVSVLYALSLPNMYKSTAVLSPAASSGGGVSAFGGQLGGLASLAGINLGGEGATKTAEALEILQSWAFIEEFIQEQGIEAEVIEVNGWDAQSGELVYNLKDYDPAIGEWKSKETNGGKPSSWELYLSFKRYLSVSQDKTSGFTSLSVEYYSPELAKKWAEALVEKINTRIKTRDAAEAKKNINFLSSQIEMTPISNMQAVFYQLIEDQTKTLMLTAGSTEYVFNTVSEPRVAEQRSKPKRAVICMVGAFLGGFLGVFIALTRYFIRKSHVE